jgi:hypothetical protein
MVGLVQKVVVILAMTAGLLAGLGASLPGAIPTTVPAVCVQVPLVGNGLQAGYCP